MDLHNFHQGVTFRRCVSPVAIGTTGTGKTGKIVDRQGYGGVEFIFDYGTVTATNAAFTATIFEGDVTGTMTSVADADLVGTEALASLGQAATRTSGVSKNVTLAVGYKGNKRYCNGKVSSTITAGPPIAITAALFNPESVTGKS
jgi:hypothetical protein